MNWSRGLIVNGLIGILGVASLIAVVATTGLVSTKDREGREQNLLPVFRVEDVLSLDLSENGRQISLQRGSAKDGGAAAFELVRPVKELADAATVDKFLNGIAGAKALRPVADGTNRNALGLEAPSARIVLRSKKFDCEIDLGGAAPTPEGAHYVEVRSAGAPPKILLVDKSVSEDLGFDLDAFRLRSLVSLNEADVARVSIKSPSLDLNLVRGAGKTFLLDGEQKFRADRDTVSSLFFQLSRMSANRFLTNAEAEAALAQNRAHFVLEAKDPQDSVSIDVGGACPGDDTETVAERTAPSAQAACTSRELDATLALKRDAFLDEHAFSLHVDEVEEFDIASGAEKFRLVRKGTSFVLHAKTDSDVALEAGNQRINDVLEARGNVIQQPKLDELGLEPTKTKVTLRSSAGSEEDVNEEVVRVGNKDRAGNLYVFREADGVTLAIPPDHARAFAFDSTLLYAKKLSEFGPSSFISAEIERRAGKEVLSRDASGALQLESPKGFEADPALAAEVVQTLGALEAERFVADADDGSFGFSRSPLNVHFTFKSAEGPKIEHTLRFGDDTALGVFATLDQGGPIFVLARSVRDALDTLLINRAPFSVDPSTLAGFTLESEGRTLRFARHGDHFEPNPKASFPEDRLADLLEAFDGLRPEAGIHTGPAEAAEGMAKPALTLRISPQKGATQSLIFGAGDSWRGTSIFYLRIAGVDATFVIAQNKIRPLLAAF
jgi:hypothetical protein